MKAVLIFPAFLLALLLHPHTGHCAEKENLRLKINGMHCSSCISMIQQSVEKLPGVKSVSFDLTQGIVDVRCDSAAIRAEAVKRAIQRLGYTLADPERTKRALADK